jgi:biopolymer transport protein ExbD
MSAMIDIVFLLLVFFILTFRIVPAEGDLMADMPRLATGPPSTDRSMNVYLTAHADGRLAGIRLEDRPVSRMNELRELMIAMSADAAAPGEESPQVTIHSDPHLKYQHLVAALTAVNGYVDEHGQVVRLFDKVRLAPQAER